MYSPNYKEAFEDLFMKYNVDIFFTGHVHLYERQYPTYQDEPVSTSYVNPTATIHIIAGGAGVNASRNFVNSLEY